MLEKPLLSVVMPCLNEERTVGSCVELAKTALEAFGRPFEIIIADNGSTDASREVAEAAGARVVSVTEKGYGAALMGGFKSARGSYILMGDADMSYAFEDAPKFLAKIEEGYDMVVGNRFLGGISAGAMPALHKYLGNPVLSFIGRLFFKTPIGDFHCGLRAFDREKLLALGLEGNGMEFASEMILRFALHGYRLAEIPTPLRPDGRDRKPHLRSWRDGWRHLKLLLLFCPFWLFSVPGTALFLFGLALMAILLAGPLAIGSVTLDVHTLVYAAMFQIAGVQILSMGLFAKGYAVSHGLIPGKPSRSGIPMEWGVVLGLVLMLLGVGGTLYAMAGWSSTHFSNLNPIHSLRIVIPSSLLITFGLQCVFMSFMSEVLRMRTASQNSGIQSLTT